MPNIKRFRLIIIIVIVLVIVPSVRALIEFGSAVVELAGNLIELASKLIEHSTVSTRAKTERSTVIGPKNLPSMNPSVQSDTFALFTSEQMGNTRQTRLKNTDDAMIKNWQNKEITPKSISLDSEGHSPSEFPQKDHEPQIQSPQLIDETTVPECKEGKQSAAKSTITGGSKSPPVPYRSERGNRALEINLYTEINSVRIDLNSFKPEKRVSDGKLEVLIKNYIIGERPIPVGGESNTIDWKIDEDKAWDLCLTISEKIAKRDLQKSKLEKGKILITCINVANAKGRQDMISIFQKRMEQ